MSKSIADAVAEDAVVAEEPKMTAEKEFNKTRAKIKANANVLKKSDTVGVALAPMYRPYFGDIMTVSLSGLSIYFPVDGRTYQIPKPYAAMIHERRRRVDDMLTRTGRMANIQGNRESYAGEITLIPK